MKVYKKLLSIFLILVLVISIFPNQVFSKEIEAEEDFVYSETYQNFVIPMYNGEEGYGVYDEQGNDVTSTFVIDTHFYHDEKQFSNVIHYLKENHLSLAKTEFIKDEKKDRANSGTSGWFSKEYRNYVDMRNSYGNLASDVEIGYIIKCHASRDYDYNITSYGQPSITKSFGKTGWFLNDVSTNAVNKGKYIAINVSFTACWNVNLLGGIINTTFMSINRVVRNETYCPG